MDPEESPPSDPQQSQPIAAGQINLTVEFKFESQVRTPVKLVTVPVPVQISLNQFVDTIEYYFLQQAEAYKTDEEASVIYIANKTLGNSQLSYNKPVSDYFRHGDVCVAFCEVQGPALKREPEVAEENKLPVTVITGFLGSGKTTLLNRILKEKHGKRIMVIQNEFGAIELDGTLVKDSMFSQEDITVLDNGCMCCTVRGDLGKAFAQILDKKKKDSIKIEHIIVETTGIANPAPIIQTFYQAPDVQAQLKLDGILTLIDAKNVSKHIDEVPEEGKVNECVEQIVFADRILLNKMDLVPGPVLQELLGKIRSINKFARVFPTTQAQIKLEKILNIGAFSLTRLLENDKEFLDEPEDEYSCSESDCSHDHEHDHDHKHDHSHDKKEHGHKHDKKEHDHKHDKKEHDHKHDKKEHDHKHDKKEHDHKHEHSHDKKEHDHKHDKKEHDHKHDKKEHDHKHEKGHDHKHDKKEGHDHKHDHKHKKKKHKHKHKHKLKKKQELTHSSGVSSIGIQREGAVDVERFEQFMVNVIRNFARDIYRAKGIINTSTDKKMVFHGVHELFDTNMDSKWGAKEPRVNKLVFIGKNLPKEMLVNCFEKCIVSGGDTEEPKSPKNVLPQKRKAEAPEPPTKRVAS